MQISPETKKVSEIFPIEGQQKYKIPIYQRNYSWNNKLIETFIEDIDSEQRGYYIGNLLITRSENEAVEEIVDGQQRLTTISLLLLGIYEISKNFEKTDSKKVGAIQADIKRKLLINEDIRTPRYTLLNSDDEIFKDLLKTLDDEKNGTWRNRFFGIRYHNIKEILSDKFEDFNKLKNFYDKLNETEILKITVTKLSDAFSIFSALNSKGLPLTLVDLLKNEYLKQATKENITNDVALSNWDTLVNIFIHDEDVNINDVTQFLLNNYDAFESIERRSITKSEALELYRRKIENGSAYIDVLEKRAEWFDFLKNQNDKIQASNDIKECVLKLNYLDPSQSFPLLLFLLVKSKELELNEEDINNILNNVISFFVRRNITLRPKASSVKAMFINLNRDITKDNIKGKQIVDLVLKELKAKSDSDDEFRSRIISQGLFDKSKSTTKFILIDLERKFGDFFNKSNPDTLEDSISVGKNKRQIPRWSIEHILPQGDALPIHWQTEISPHDITQAKAVQEEYVHKIGNLTLTPYNSELGQLSFVDKKNKKAGSKYVGLRLEMFINKSIIDEKSNETWETKVKWTKEDIMRRSQYIADKVIETYKL